MNCFRQMHAREGLCALVLTSLASCTPSNPPSAAAPKAVQPQGPDRSSLPEAGPAPHWRAPIPQRWQTKSGVGVLFEEHGSVPLVSLRLVIPRGAATDPKGKEGLTELTTDLLDEGAGDLDALELSQRLQTLASDYWVSVNVDAVVFSVSTIRDSFAETVALLSDIVRRPQFSPNDFERRKSQQIAQSVASEASPQTGWAVALLQALFGEGYGGHRTGGNANSLANIQLSDVQRHYRAVVSPEHASFVVTGGIDKESVAAALEAGFGDWQEKAADVPVRPVLAAPEESRLYFVDYPGAAQSVVGLMRRAAGADADNLPVATVFNESFGGAFTSRVNMNLREDKGYTYGARSLYSRYRKSGFFGVFASVRTDVTRESVDEIMQELSAPCGERPMSIEERNEAIAGLLSEYPSRFESVGKVASELEELPVFQRPADWYRTWPDRIAGVTTAQVQNLAQTHCDVQKFTLVVAGDKAKVLPTLASLQLPVVELSPRGQPL